MAKDGNNAWQAYTVLAIFGFLLLLGVMYAAGVFGQTGQHKCDALGGVYSHGKCLDVKVHDL